MIFCSYHRYISVNKLDFLITSQVPLFTAHSLLLSPSLWLWLARHWDLSVQPSDWPLCLPAGGVRCPLWPVCQGLLWPVPQLSALSPVLWGLGSHCAGAVSCKRGGLILSQQKPNVKYWITDGSGVYHNPFLHIFVSSYLITRTWQCVPRLWQSVPMRFRPLGLLGPMRRPSEIWRRNWHKLRALSTHATPLLQPSLP